jgi:hypothetical protein
MTSQVSVYLKRQINTKIKSINQPETFFYKLLSPQAKITNKLTKLVLNTIA